MYGYKFVKQIKGYNFPICDKMQGLMRCYYICYSTTRIIE